MKGMTVIVLMWEEAAIKDDVIEYDIAFNIIYIAKGHDEVTTILVGKYHGYFWRKVNQNQQYTACC
ncbi:hypothetical protein CRN69_09075 [Klebsiella pneumoniae]|nr:hypothetical protein CO702_19365 [Klebsiella pneumoniae]ATM64824.1 hypothetical protein CRN69_09075 [Klebsiella pneumoniae]